MEVDLFLSPIWSMASQRDFQPNLNWHRYLIFPRTALFIWVSSTYIWMFPNLLLCFKNTADTVQGWLRSHRFRFRNPSHSAIHREDNRQYQMGRNEPKCSLRMVHKCIKILKMHTLQYVCSEEERSTGTLFCLAYMSIKGNNYLLWIMLNPSIFQSYILPMMMYSIQISSLKAYLML